MDVSRSPLTVRSALPASRPGPWFPRLWVRRTHHIGWCPTKRWLYEGFQHLAVRSIDFAIFMWLSNSSPNINLLISVASSACLTDTLTFASTNDFLVTGIVKRSQHCQLVDVILQQHWQSRLWCWKTRPLVLIWFVTKRESRVTTDSKKEAFTFGLSFGGSISMQFSGTGYFLFREITFLIWLTFLHDLGPSHGQIVVNGNSQ